MSPDYQLQELEFGKKSLAVGRGAQRKKGNLIRNDFIS